MVSIIMPIEDKFKERLNLFSWINWSEVAREESLKKEIFEKYIKDKKLSKDDEKFCENIDWHPVDELPMKKEYVEKLKKIDKNPLGKSMTVEEFNKWCKSL